MKRAIRIILISLVVLAAAAAVGWFVAIPRLATNYIKGKLVSVEQKFQRDLGFEDLYLRSFSSFGIANANMMDVHQEGEASQPQTALSCEKMTIDLDKIPFPGRDFKVKYVKFDQAKIFVRKTEGKLNFDDFIQLLLKERLPVEPAEEEASGWRRFVSPFPETEFENLIIELATPVAFHDTSVKTVILPAMHVSRADGEFHIAGDLQLVLEHNRETLRYDLTMTADIKNPKSGEIHLTPKESTLPLYLTKGFNREVSIGQFDVRLPTTFVASSVDVREPGSDVPEFQAKAVRMHLMTFPPKKVKSVYLDKGVYFKEVELVSPELQVVFKNDTNNLLELYSKKDQYLKSEQPEENKATEAVPTEEKQAEKDDIRKRLTEVFFTQRLFVTDAAIHLMDRNPSPIGDMNLFIPEFELGYRSIRNLVNFEGNIKTSGPVSLDMEVGGLYRLGNEKGDLAIDIRSLGYGNQMRQIRHNILTKYDLNEELNDAQPEGEKTEVPKYVRWMKSLNVMEDFSASLKTSVTFDLPAEKYRVVSKGSLHHLNFSKPKLSAVPVDISVDEESEILLDRRANSLSIPQMTLTSGKAKAELKASVTWNQLPDSAAKAKSKTQNAPETDTKFSFDFEVPPQNAQDVFEALPQAFRSELDGLTFAGMLAFKLKASGWKSRLEDMDLEYKVTPSPDFDATAYPVDRNLMDINKGFVLNVRDPNALMPHQITIPPSIYPVPLNDYQMRYTPMVTAEDIRARFPDWVLFEDLNPWLIQLITTTEDGNFFNHSGFSPLQIKAALAKNIKKGEFSRGASTISMQLIKNLFFERQKNLSRKAQEVIYTWLMENVIRIPKKRIMELYFNIIEFGPEIYGIQDAAKYYFGKRSQDLSLKESAYLMAIIPSPRKGAIHRSKPTLDNYLNKTISWYISEMYRRKCDKEAIRRMTERYAKNHQTPPFIPCCPSEDHIEKLKAQELSFYIPNPADPMAYDLRPDLYLPDGTPTFTMSQQGCGLMSDENESDIEEIFDDELLRLPLQDTSPWQ